MLDSTCNHPLAQASMKFMGWLANALQRHTQSTHTARMGSHWMSVHERTEFAQCGEAVPAAPASFNGDRRTTIRFVRRGRPSHPLDRGELTGGIT